eukprot:TRINITY_DN2032_c0_g3_i2.p1 TRINITY_DN2032_c0_g3~~TRINITY_DN2032_c0_g3_i2.p1  ORF type:complete len:287 (+),score=81.30 TRINITY_DN2032_c0_g3_i2:71-931(+)
MSKKTKGAAKKRDVFIADPETLDEYQKITQSWTVQAQEILSETLPRKILFLHESLKTSPLFNTPIAEVLEDSRNLFAIVDQALAESKGEDGPSDQSMDAPSESKKRKLNPSSSPSSSSSSSSSSEEPASKIHPSLKNLRISTNSKIQATVDFLKKEIMELIDMVGLVKIWIQLNIPRIEDGGNFGVSIQEETVSELNRAEDSGFSVLDTLNKYFATRGKLASKVLKYPGIRDYIQSIIELDEKEYTNLRLCCVDLRNNCAILHDLISKNLDKIKQPRSEDHYSNMV